MRRGFSLIELAISITVIGLIIAAITSGAKIYNQAKMRKVVVNLNALATHVKTFEETYGSIPGDFDGATTFFSDCAETTSNCNGDGDRTTEKTSGTDNEVYLALVHLSRSGIIDNYIHEMLDSHAGDMLGNAFEINDDSGGYMFYGGESGSAGIASEFAFGKQIVYGRYSTTLSSYEDNILTPADAYALDKKIDDGNSASSLALGGKTGNLRVHSASSSCLSGVNDSYLTNALNKQCRLHWRFE